MGNPHLNLHAADRSCRACEHCGPVCLDGRGRTFILCRHDALRWDPVFYGVATGCGFWDQKAQAARATMP